MCDVFCLRTKEVIASIAMLAAAGSESGIEDVLQNSASTIVRFMLTLLGYFVSKKLLHVMKTR
jgi:hypothetical protein